MWGRRRLGSLSARTGLAPAPGRGQAPASRSLAPAETSPALPSPPPMPPTHPTPQVGAYADVDVNSDVLSEEDKKEGAQVGLRRMWEGEGGRRRAAEHRG
jgi:hypothetical protein